MKFGIVGIINNPNEAYLIEEIIKVRSYLNHISELVKKNEER